MIGGMVAGINFISHVLSFVAFAALIYALFVLKRRQEFLAKLFAPFNSPDTGHSLRVDWPEVFLKNLSSTLGIQYEGGSAKNGKPVRINSRAWFDMFLSHGICLIRCSYEQKKLVVQVKPVKKLTLEDLKKIANTLEHSLGGEVHVQII
jgi:hypothetical protein